MHDGVTGSIYPVPLSCTIVRRGYVVLSLGHSSPTFDLSTKAAILFNFRTQITIFVVWFFFLFSNLLKFYFFYLLKSTVKERRKESDLNQGANCLNGTSWINSTYSANCTSGNLKFFLIFFGVLSVSSFIIFYFIKEQIVSTEPLGSIQLTLRTAHRVI